MDFNKILICIFHYNERTLNLNRYCWEKLGLKNIKVFSSKSGFYEKLNEMFKYSYENKDKYDLIIKSDADVLVFGGIFKLIEKAYDNHMILGYFFDKFMNRWRGSGPKIYNISLIKYIHKNNIKAQNVLKPESKLFNLFRQQKNLKAKCFNIKTCLHEYEQYPSKVLNALITRYHRNHLLNEYLYSKNFLLESRNHPEYMDVIHYLYNKYIPKNKISSKKNCNYIYFNYFDTKIEEIKSDDIPILYKKYLKLYKTKIKIKI